MSPAKVALAAVAAALSLSACGVAAKPVAGSAQADAKGAKELKANDPRTKHVKCLAKDHIRYHELLIHGHPSIQVGTRPTGPTIEFLATPGAAQNEAIQGLAQGAEVISAALVYPLNAPNRLLAKVEKCMTAGATG